MGCDSQFDGLYSEPVVTPSKHTGTAAALSDSVVPLFRRDMERGVTAKTRAKADSFVDYCLAAIKQYAGYKELDD